jgi:sodium-dependent dicarboxylate transporter 2/3/5
MGKGHIRIDDYAEGRLTTGEMAEAEQHLATCDRCRKRLEQRQLGARERGAFTVVRTLVARMARGSVAVLEPLLKELSSHLERPREEAPPQPFEPLRVLTPRIIGGVRLTARFVGRFGLVLLLTVGTLLLPTPEGLSPEGHRAMAGFVFTAAILALEPVSLPIAALMVPAALVALGTADTTEAFATFSRPVVFLILASLFLAEALRKHGLTRRIALKTIVSSGGGVGAILLGLMLVAAFFSMWVENTATAAMLIPVAMTIARQVEDPEKAGKLLTLLVLGLAYSASVGGMTTVMGSASNAVAFGFITQIRPWSFVNWMYYGIPAFLIIFPLTWWLLMRLTPVPVKRLELEGVRRRMEELGPMGKKEKEIIAMMGVAVVFFVGGSFIEKALGLPGTLLSAAMVAVLAVCYLAVREIINWEDVKGVSWGIFFIIGAGLSLGETLSRTGVTAWFATLLAPLVTGLPLPVSLLVLVSLSALMTNFLNNTTIAAVFVPVLIKLAQDDPSLEAMRFVIPVTLATTFGYSLPSASGRMALIAATGIVSRGKMIRCGLIMTAVSSVVLAALFYLIAVLGWI